MSAPSRRRFFQFNLRGLLLLTTVVAIFFGLWVSKLHRQQQALKNLRRHTTRKNWIRYREVPYTGWLHRPWLSELVGEGFFDEPVQIRLFEPMEESDRVGAADLHPLGQLPTLERLLLDFTNAGDDGMPYLRALRNLQHLDLRASRVGDEALSSISGLAKLEKLDLTKTPVTDAGLKHLAGLARLRILNLRRTKISDEGIRWLKNLEQLVSLNLIETQVEGKVLGELRGLKGLRELRLSGSKLTDRGLESLARCAVLESLWLDGTSITGSGFAAIRDLPALARLDLSGTALTDEGLQRLPAAPRLRRLKLNDTLITDEGLKQLAQYRSLEALELRGTKITGKALSYLQALPRLIYLNLCATGIDDEDIEALNEMCPLVCVSLLETKVTQRGLNRLQVAGSVSDEPLDKRTMARLNEQTELDFVNFPLEDVVEYLRQRHDLQFLMIDPRLDRPSSNVATTPVTRNARDISLIEALEETMAPLGLVMVYRHGVPLITTRPVRPALYVPELAEGQEIGWTLETVLSEKTEIDFTSQLLSDVMLFLSERHSNGDRKFSIRTDEEAFRRAGRTSEVPITWHIKGIPLRSALGLILDPLDMTCGVDGDALIIRPAPKRDQ